ncbi:V-type ATPase subunit [Nanoarchaeota archaeon]
MDLVVPAVVGIGTLGALAVIVPTIGQALKMQPYLYANTRCSARSGFLLKDNNYAEMMQVTYPKELFALMEGTLYKDIFERHDNFQDISRQLEKNMFETFKWLEEIAPKKMTKLIHLINKRFEIKEIKKILNYFKSDEEISELDFIDDSFLKLKLQEVRTFPDLVTALDGTIYTELFAEKSEDDIPQLITLIDKMWMEEVLMEISKNDQAADAVKDYWLTLVDLFNVRLAFRKLKNEIDINFIYEGHIPVKELEGVGDMNQLEGVIEKTKYKDYFNKESYLDMEVSFFAYLRQLASDVNAKYTLTSGPIVRFMIEKELEIRNLNLILKLKLNNFPKEKIEKLVV